MKKKISFIVFMVMSSTLLSQSIVNTEKLFTTNDDGLGVSSELSGSSISGNASVLLLEYGLNFSYKKDDHYLRLLSGGEYINENSQEVSNSLFTQFRYNYFINKKNRLFIFSQIQTNAILLLERRLLGGAGFRRNLIDVKRDSSSRYELDFSAGLMQEHELLNRTNLPLAEKYNTNYTRAIFSIVGIIDISEKFTIVNTTYYQQYIKNMKDYRLLNETNLMIGINEWFSVSIDLEYRFDSEPPSILKDRDFNTNIGLALNF